MATGPGGKTGSEVLLERTLSTEGSRSRSGSVIGRIVLVAVDHSENAKTAFNYYVDNIRKPDDLIILVHCPEAPKLPSFKFKSGIAPPVDEWKKVLDEVNSRSRVIEEDYEGTLVAKKFKYKVRGESGYKNPGEGIVKIGDEEKANLIVIGTRGHSGIKKTLLGSVSEYVARHSHVPTLIVPGKAK